VHVPDEADGAGVALEVDQAQIARITFDLPESPVNLLSSEVMRRLDQNLSALESRIATGRVAAVVVRSGKPGTFIAGANVAEIAGLRDAAQATAKSREGQRIFDRLARLRVPTVAAIDGVCLGGGTELILACDFRIASDRPATRIGLPEVKLGILPGFGGSIRLPRVCGLQAALDLMLTGKAVRPRAAKRIGLVDRIAPTDRFDASVAEFVGELVVSARERPRTARRRSLADRLLEGTAPGRRLLLTLARRRVTGQTKGFYPAPLRILDVIEETFGLPVDRALEIEARALGELATSEESRSLVRVFQLSQAAKKALSPDRLEARRPVRKAAVLGAGVMGGAIAEAIAAVDVPVLLKDIDQGALDAGLRHASDLLGKAAKKKVFGEDEAGLKFALISGTLTYDDFADVDLAVEAIVERMPIKQQVLREAEEHLDHGAVFATNTSSLSVTKLASAAEHPQRVVGLHFFNPVHRMPLVEVIRTEQTSDEALATTFAFALQLGKTPVIVADRPGFLVNRLLAPYLNETGFLLDEGVGIGPLDAALSAFGMPMGPCRLLDEIGFDIAGHAGHEMASAFGERMRPSGALDRLRDTGRLGKKNGRGFYLYEGGRQKKIDPAAEALFPSGDGVGPGEMRRRCLYSMVNEAARALEERVVASADDVDLAMIMGTGFPPFRGGLLRWADREGIPGIVEALGEFEERLGARFAVSSLLKAMAREGQTFTSIG